MLRRFGPDDDDTDSEVMSEEAEGMMHSSDAIVQRLIQAGVPEELIVVKKQAGLVEYVKDRPSELKSLVKAFFPDVDWVRALTPPGADESSLSLARQTVVAQCQEAINWVEWCAFGSEPHAALEEVRRKLGGARGVCGAVWGSNDLAYRCHTCEHDQTCAICVACFQDGDHSHHDYVMIRTTGGCCDCGDATAWKESGFCSRHRGSGQVPPLPDSLLNSMRPVLEALFLEWKDRLVAAFQVSAGRSRRWKSMATEERIASRMSLCIVLMLLDYCNCSENMLNFTAESVSRKDIDLLDTLMTTERFLPRNVCNKLHELLYKLLGDPNFKYRFAQDFIKRYPQFLRDSLNEEHSSTSRRKEHPSILGTFSVQIFTVPTLTPRLVLESKLLDMLFGTLKDFFVHCIGPDGRFLVSKPAVHARAYCRALDDLKYVMSHLKVAQYVIHELPQLCRTWLQFLAFIQGMYPQKRITSIHIEEENEDWISAFYLESQMAGMHPVFVDGTIGDQHVFEGADEWPKSPSEGSEQHSQTEAYTKKALISTARSLPPSSPTLYHPMSPSERSEQHSQMQAYTNVDGVLLSKALVWLISECVTVLDSWFAVDAARDSSRTAEAQERKRMHVGGSARSPAEDSGTTLFAGMELLRRRRSAGTPQAAAVSELPQELYSRMEVDEPQAFSPEKAQWWMGSEEDYGTGLSLLVGDELWPSYDFDVGRQEVSFHIPLHRMLARLFHKALEEHEKKRNAADIATTSSSGATTRSSFLLQLLPEPFGVPGFAALLMEHPLRLQVLCAQAQAGMWRRNGHTIIGLCDIYRSVQWCEVSLELDLFLLQCCGAMAPAEEFVGRVQSCFGLSDYFTLFLWRPNEYEPFLAQEFLVLLIRLISERGFCGLSLKESLRRELIQRLAIGDASRSVLLNALPPRLQDNNHLQETLEEVATYRRPQGMQQGKYVLRPQSWRELDLYHPRWTPRDLQAAEERYLRACRSSAVFSQAPKWRNCFAPLQNLANIAVSAKLHDILRAVFFHAAFSVNPSESRAPENLFFTALHLLSLGLDVCAAYPTDEVKRGKMLENDGGSSSLSFETSSPLSADRPPLLSQAAESVHVGGADGTQLPGRQSTLSLLVLLMKKYAASEGEQLLVSEAAQCNVGSFIKNLLHRFAELDRQCMYAIETLAPEIIHRVSKPDEGPSSKPKDAQAEVSEAERKKAYARARQAAIMAKMRAAQDKFLETSEGSESKKNKVDDGTTFRDDSPLCALCRDRGSSSQLCILVLVQRSRLLALAQKLVPSWDRVASKKIDETSAMVKDSSPLSAVNRGAENLISELRHWLEGAVGDRLERLNNREDFLELLRGELPSILNSDRSAASPSARPLEAGSQSEMEAGMDDNDSQEISVDSSWWRESTNSSRDPSENEVAIFSVLAEYVSAVSRTQAEAQVPTEAESPRDSASRVRRLARNGMESKIYNSIGLNDFIGLNLSACGHAAHQECIDRYYSSVLQRHYSRSLFEGVQIVDPDMGEFLCPVCRRLSNCILPVQSSGDQVCSTSYVYQGEPFRLPQARSILYRAAELMCKPGFRKAVSRKLPSSFKAVLDFLATRLCGLFYPDKDHVSSLADGRSFQGLFLWDVLRYSVMASELAARTKSLIVGQQDPMTRLVVLEEAAEPSKGSILPLLFRTASSTMNQSSQAILLRTRGMQLMVASICHGTSRDQLAEKGFKGPSKDSADVQFWKRTADPILVHEPFSSLIWVLFALPLPLSSYQEGPFVAFVHLFYLVCLVQCIGTLGRSLSLEPSLPPHVQKFVAALSSRLAGTCVSFPPTEDSNSTQGSPVDEVRRLTLPYLRRCGLLQTVCCSSASNVVPVAGSNSWDLSNVHNLLAAGAYRDREYKPGQAEEFQLREVEELEKRFQLPSLLDILADDSTQNLVMRWCQHLHNESGTRYFLSASKPVRASPFQLMRLPRLFQDLVQHFVRERCPRCNNVPDRPALCLLCGALCCGSGPTGCCSANLQSECYRHAIACGGGVGVYLMLKKTNVLLVRRERQAMWPSPYLDAFGEEDQDLRRGKPLYLSEERYAALTAMVASHGLDYSSSVLSHTTRDTIF